MLPMIFVKRSIVFLYLLGEAVETSQLYVSAKRGKLKAQLYVKKLWNHIKELSERFNIENKTARVSGWYYFQYQEQTSQ